MTPLTPVVDSGLHEPGASPPEPAARRPRRSARARRPAPGRGRGRQRAPPAALRRGRDRQDADGVRRAAQGRGRRLSRREGGSRPARPPRAARLDPGPRAHDAREPGLRDARRRPAGAPGRWGRGLARVAPDARARDRRPHHRGHRPADAARLRGPPVGRRAQPRGHRRARAPRARAAAAPARRLPARRAARRIGPPRVAGEADQPAARRGGPAQAPHAGRDGARRHADPGDRPAGAARGVQRRVRAHGRHSPPHRGAARRAGRRGRGRTAAPSAPPRFRTRSRTRCSRASGACRTTRARSPGRGPSSVAASCPRSSPAAWIVRSPTSRRRSRSWSSSRSCTRSTSSIAASTTSATSSSGTRCTRPWGRPSCAISTPAPPSSGRCWSARRRSTRRSTSSGPACARRPTGRRWPGRAPRAPSRAGARRSSSTAAPSPTCPTDLGSDELATLYEGYCEAALAVDDVPVIEETATLARRHYLDAGRPLDAANMLVLLAANARRDVRPRRSGATCSPRRRPSLPTLPAIARDATSSCPTCARCRACSSSTPDGTRPRWRCSRRHATCAMASTDPDTGDIDYVVASVGGVRRAMVDDGLETMLEGRAPARVRRARRAPASRPSGGRPRPPCASWRTPSAEVGLREGLRYADEIEQSYCRHVMAATTAHLAWAAGRWDEAVCDRRRSSSSSTAAGGARSARATCSGSSPSDAVRSSGHAPCSTSRWRSAAQRGGGPRAARDVGAGGDGPRRRRAGGRAAAV